MKRLEVLFVSKFGVCPEKIEKLAGAGSSREYFRLTSGNVSAIGTLGNDKAENEAFIYLSHYFSGKHLPVPSVLAVDDSNEAYLQDDLGDVSLFDVIREKGVDDVLVKSLLQKTMKVLALMHSSWHDDADLSKCYPRGEMDFRSVMWDLNYFKYCFLKAAGINVDEDRLQDEMEQLAHRLTNQEDRTLILRDFQSRNIIIKDYEPYIIDFQGARIGSGLYDVASFLWQARINLPDECRWHFAEKYIAAAGKCGMNVGDGWRDGLVLNALFRMLQVLGAYGFRGLIEHKSQFITPISVALTGAMQLIRRIKEVELPYMREIIEGLASSEKFKQETDDKKLTVKVMSFSYKKGIPEDYTGNGGGFVFDCRAMHNPGRYEQYRNLTGSDEPVIKFLEEQGEIQKFLSNCYSLVDAAVETYIGRGFTSLMVCFGCTGGRHRSLYSAEHMAAHIAELYDCHVQLIHREQNIHKRLK